MSEQIFEIIRKSLDHGRTIEIEGLGVLRRDSSGYALEAETQPRVFVAYVAEDLDLARRLCDSLSAAGCSPWLDKDKLLPGQNWPRALERAIQVADAFVACFSTRATHKRGQFQSELRYALDCARRVPLDLPFLVPVRLEPCAVPRRISEQVQYVDLFPNWERGAGRVARAIHRAAAMREKSRLSA